MINTKNEKGFLLFTCYLLLAAFVVFAVALYAQSVEFIKSTERNKKRIVAFNLAEAGIDDIFYKIKMGAIDSFPWTSGYMSMDSGDVRGGYSTTASDMGGGIIKVATTGYSPAQVSSTESVESRTITSYIQSANVAAFNSAVMAQNSISISGSAVVDSYNSNSGSYGGGNVSSGGDLLTNSTSEGAVSLSGNADVHGNITTGVGSSTDSAVDVSGSASVTGSTVAATAVTPAPTLTTSTSSAGALSIGGRSNITLSAGTYHYSSLNISGSGRLTATGPVSIYVSGAVAIGGNGITTSSNTPPNMTIYVTGNSNVTLTGNGTLYAGIYAPNSNVTNTGNGDLYGAVVANNYSQSGNGDLHFDEALKTPSDGQSTPAMLSWKESGLFNS